MTTARGITIGNALGVALPNTVQECFDLKDRDALRLTDGPNGSMRVTSDDRDIEVQMRAARVGMGAYRNTLRELANAAGTIAPK